MLAVGESAELKVQQFCGRLEQRLLAMRGAGEGSRSAVSLLKAACELLQDFEVKSSSFRAAVDQLVADAPPKTASGPSVDTPLPQVGTKSEWMTEAKFEDDGQLHVDEIGGFDWPDSVSFCSYSDTEDFPEESAEMQEGTETRPEQYL